MKPIELACYARHLLAVLREDVRADETFRPGDVRGGLAVAADWWLPGRQDYAATVAQAECWIAEAIEPQAKYWPLPAVAIVEWAGHHTRKELVTLLGKALALAEGAINRMEEQQREKEREHAVDLYTHDRGDGDG